MKYLIRLENTRTSRHDALLEFSPIPAGTVIGWGSDEHSPEAFSAALASGIYLSVPQPDGSRCRVKCPVVGSSPIYSDHFPDDFKSEFDEQTAREFNTTIR